MADVLRIDASDGSVTPYASAFRDKFVFGSFGTEFPQHRLVALVGDNAVAAPVVAELTHTRAGYVTGIGHGVYSSFIGTDGHAIWNPGSDLSALSGGLVHLLSCQTGASLGVRMVAAGARAFWGYSVDFQFLFRVDRPADLADDSVAEVYFRMDVIIDRGVLTGKTAREIYNSVTDYVAKVLPQLPPTQQVLLLSNYAHLVWPGLSWGDPDATV